MPTHRVRTLVRSALAPPVAGPDDRPDRDLLARFLATGDEAAFATLVRRHGPMVLAVCRSILRNPTDAEDAFQATFLVLVRKAAVIRERAALGAWLYAVAGRVARKLRSATRQPAALPDDLPDHRPVGEAMAFDLQAALDEEVARLPEAYRLVVQACYTTGRTTAEAAVLLGWPKGTVLTRLAWARRRLRARLTARGVGLAVGAFGTLLNRPAVFAVGRALITRTTRVAAATAAGESVSELVSERTVTMTEGVIRAMTMSKLKWTAGAVLVAALAGAGIGRWAVAGEPGPQPPTTARTHTSPAPVEPAGKLAEPIRVADSAPPADAPARNPAQARPVPRPPAIPTDALVFPQPVANEVPPADLVPAQPVQAGGARQFVVSRPVGNWSQEVLLQDGGEGQPVRVVVKFDEDHLTMRMIAVVERQELETVLEADYSITRDSVVFGVVTGFDVRIPAGGRVPPSVTLNEEDYVDQPFTFRFRVDGGTLTVRDLRLPGVKQPGDVGLAQVFAGRFAAAKEEPAAGHSQPAGKGRAPSVVPRRVVPSTSGRTAVSEAMPYPGPVLLPGQSTVGPTPILLPGQPTVNPAVNPVPPGPSY